MIYGYVRISTTKQEKGNSKEDQSTAILSRYPEATIIEETYSGAKERPKFTHLLDICQRGDTIVVTKLDRFCRSTKEGLEYIDFLKLKGVNVHILNMGLIEDTPMGRLIVTNLLAFAEFERALIKERTDAGKAIARQKPGYKDGRHKIEVPNFAHYHKKTADGEMSVAEAIRELGITKAKWYRLCKEVLR